MATPPHRRDAHPDPISVLADGTIKSIHPLSGTEVWTVPGRGARPGSGTPAPAPRGSVPCAFCLERAQEVPPEKARVVREGADTRIRREVPPEELSAGVAEFRRVANLFEILPFAYWQANHGEQPHPRAVAALERWRTSAVGRAHLEGVLRTKFLARGGEESEWDGLSGEERLAGAIDFFAGGHDLIIGRRHRSADGRPASSGTLSADEHAAYTALTVEAMADLYAVLPSARYVATFQNWLGPAGASFDHLHKQLAAIDSVGVQVQRELRALAADPHAYARMVETARRHDLVVAENDTAVAFAGFGHRYPTFEVFSQDPTTRPFEQSEDHVRGMSDLVHALHAATGPGVPCNEEWHHRPRGVEAQMPWRIHLKWRTSTLAGFEGGTRIYVTTLSPWDLRDLARERLSELRDEGHLAPSVRLR
ncbi:MAG: DUF4921 family protein [Mobilicoccus sp.]|nr:DUF4921 family protein [Mobilicoccus sp.]